MSIAVKHVGHLFSINRLMFRGHTAAEEHYGRVVLHGIDLKLLISFSA